MEMSEETIVIEVEPESIKTNPIDVKVSSIVLNAESPDSLHITSVVEDAIDSTEAGHDDQKLAKKNLVWDVKMVDSNEDDAQHVRRKSASLLFEENRKLAVRSRYRGGSFGSCHDMCKFGHGHTPEVKPRIHLNKTPLSFSAGQGKGLVKTVSSIDSRKKPVVVRRLSFPKEKPVTDRAVKTVNDKKEEKSLGGVSFNGGFGNEDKSLRSKPIVKKAASMNNRVQRSHYQQEVKGKSPEDLPEKTLYMIEPIPESTKKAPPFQRNRFPKTEGGSSNIGTKTGTSKYFSPSSSKSVKVKAEKLEDTELVIKRTQKSKSSNEQTISNTEKTKLGAPKAKQNGKYDTHLIKPLVPAVEKPSKPVKEKLVLGKNGDSMSGNSKTIKAKQSSLTPRSKPGNPKTKQDVEPKAKAITRRPKVQIAEGQSFSAVWKMKFRRGKVVSLPSGTNGPVKLKFRRPRVLSNSCHAQSSGNANYKSIKIVGDDAKKDHGGEAEKVVLRRHEATSKKDDVDLNNVIEETASKLVITRKSKVKALVGAFETVMSLRDHKAAATDNS